VGVPKQKGLRWENGERIGRRYMGESFEIGDGKSGYNNRGGAGDARKGKSYVPDHGLLWRRKVNGVEGGVFTKMSLNKKSQQKVRPGEGLFKVQETARNGQPERPLGMGTSIEGEICKTPRVSEMRVVAKGIKRWFTQSPFGEKEDSSETWSYQHGRLEAFNGRKGRSA